MPANRSSEPNRAPVKHHRRALLAIGAHVECSKPFRQVEVDLQRAALPVAADCIAQNELELRPVERALAGIGRVGQAGRLDRRLQGCLGPVPDRIRADALLRSIRELDLHVVETEIAVYVQDELANDSTFTGDLLFRTEDVGVVLSEGAQAHQTMQGARRLEPVNLAELGNAQGQIAGSS